MDASLSRQLNMHPVMFATTALVVGLRLGMRPALQRPVDVLGRQRDKPNLLLHRREEYRAHPLREDLLSRLAIQVRGRGVHQVVE